MISLPTVKHGGVFLGNRKRGKPAFRCYSVKYGLIGLIAWVGEGRGCCSRVCEKAWKARRLLLIVLEAWSLKHKGAITFSKMEFM